MQSGFRYDPYAAYYPPAYPFAAVDPTDPTDVSINSTDAAEATPTAVAAVAAKVLGGSGMSTTGTTGTNIIAAPTPVGGMPSMTATGMPVAVWQRQSVPDNQLFSPQTLLNPLPQIVAGPKAAPAQCSDFLSSFANNNPLLAAGILALGFFWAIHKKRR